MKRWAIRLSAVSAVVALGWFTVAWAQRQNAIAETTTGPDFSKPPVNAAAALETGNGSTSTAAPKVITPVDSTSTANEPADPFQRAANLAGQRYRAVEPQTLQPDPNAAALATDTSEIAARQVSHNATLGAEAPQANAVQRDASFQQEYNGGINNAPASNNLGASNSVPTSPADPFSSARNPRLQTTEMAETGQTQPATPVSSEMPSTGSSRYGQLAAPNGAATAVAGEAANVAASRYLGSANDGTANYGTNSPASDNAYSRGSSFEAANDRTQRADSSGLPQNGNFSTAGLGDSTNTRQSILPLREGQLRSQEFNGGSAAASHNAIGVGGDPYSVAPVEAVEGYGKPGDKKLEGAQSPSVTIQKIAPPEIQVGKPAKFEIVVRNTGAVVAENVEVTEAIPQGTTLVGTTPQTQRGQHGEILWKIGELKPAEETRLQVDLMPVAEGEIGSVAVVQFRSSASMRTIATKPELTLELNAPKQVMIGGDVTVGIKISNPGTGAADKIVLHEMVPPGFQHPAGSELEFEVGTLKPGESRQLDLTLHAVQAGMFGNSISVTGDANLRAEQTAQIQVIAPALEVAINGPGLRYLERQAKYNVSVNNPGTAPAKDIELVTRLPKGMQFVEASDKGHYDASSHSVVWSLAELPPSQSGTVTLTTLAVEPGEQRLRGEGRASGGLSNTTEETTIVEGVAAVLFTVVDVDDPVEVGGQATYEIKVVNQGSKAANRVTVVAIMPPELKAVSAEGQSQYKIDRDRVIFEPMPRLAPKADITYRITAQAMLPGDSRIKVLLQTEEMNEPVTKEESTRIYKD